MSKEISVTRTVDLPDITRESQSLLGHLTQALGVPRDVLATDDEINYTWEQIPRYLRKIPRELRNETIVKACAAVACGLFDAAINYVWNASIVELRDKVRRFGMSVIPQILNDSEFDESSLMELRDAELLELCLKLNLINNDDFFFLNQCRDTRNNFSVAHPAMGEIDGAELISFLSRCQKHALSSKQNPKGVDTKRLLHAIAAKKFTGTKLGEWARRLEETYDEQRELIFSMLHGKYCDPESGEETRINALSICQDFSDKFSPKTKSVLVDRHQEYVAKGDEERRKASIQFFEKTSSIDLLDDSERHNLFASASRALLMAHKGWDNFYNEPPHAQRLYQLSKDGRVPLSVQGSFVEAVVTCGIGNIYGVSHGAERYYKDIVRSFSPNEVAIMLRLRRGNITIRNRIDSASSCKKKFKDLVNLIDSDSVPTSLKTSYRRWKRMKIE